MTEFISRHPDDVSGSPEEVIFGRGETIEVGDAVFTQTAEEKYRALFDHPADLVPISRSTGTALVPSFDTIMTVSQPRGALDIAVGGRLGGESSPWRTTHDLNSAIRSSVPDSASGVLRDSNLTKEGSFTKRYLESEQGKREIQQALEALSSTGYFETARRSRVEDLKAALEVADTHLLTPDSPLAQIGQVLDRIIDEGAVYYVPKHGKAGRDVVALRVSVLGWPAAIRAALSLVRPDDAGYDTTRASDRRSRAGREFPYRVTTISADAWNAAPDPSTTPSEFWDMSGDPKKALEAMGIRFEEIRKELEV